MQASFRNHILQHTGEDTLHTASAKIKMTNMTRLEDKQSLKSFERLVFQTQVSLLKTFRFALNEQGTNYIKLYNSYKV